MNIAAAQKKIESGSIVMTKLPTLKIGVTLSAITVQKATRFVEEAPREIKKKQTRSRGEERTPETHAEFG